MSTVHFDVGNDALFAALCAEPGIFPPAELSTIRADVTCERCLAQEPIVTPSTVVFLDVDGVLNSAEWMLTGAMKKHPAELEHIDPIAAARLNHIAAACPDFVLSSSWRYSWAPDQFTELLCRRGFVGRVIARTPLGRELRGTYPVKLADAYQHPRGHEIAEWLDRHPQVTRFIILDDSSDMAFLSHRLVHTSWALGLQDEHVERAIAMLSEPGPSRATGPEPGRPADTADAPAADADPACPS